MYPDPDLFLPGAKLTAHSRALLITMISLTKIDWLVNFLILMLIPACCRYAEFSIRIVRLRHEKGRCYDKPVSGVRPPTPPGVLHFNHCSAQTFSRACLSLYVENRRNPILCAFDLL